MRIGISSSVLSSKSVDRAANSGRSTIENMGIDHGRLDVIVAQKLLNSANVVAAFQQVNCKGVSVRLDFGISRTPYSIEFRAYSTCLESVK